VKSIFIFDATRLGLFGNPVAVPVVHSVSTKGWIVLAHIVVIAGRAADRRAVVESIVIKMATLFRFFGDPCAVPSVLSP
jgi:hypothetical protein